MLAHMKSFINSVKTFGKAAADYIASPKTLTVGFEANWAANMMGLTSETGLYIYQEGWSLDYGSYSSAGPLAGVDVGGNVGLGSYSVSPSIISGRGHVAGGSFIWGGQLLLDADRNWIGSRVFYGPGAGGGVSEEITVFNSFLGREW